MNRDTTQRLRLTGCLALVISPHVTRIPLWVSLFAGLILLWQVLAAWRNAPPAGRVVRIVLVVVASVAVYATFGHINGQQAGVALLVLMLTLKLTEAHRDRDVTILLGLCYLTLITDFLFSQSILMAVFLGLCAWLITACYLDANHAGAALPSRTILRGSAALIVQALPVAALLFVLFPRIPGPLWGLPADHGATAQMGLSDTMDPGSISHLARSDAVALRVRFNGPVPPKDALYWRGPVLWRFDGHTWSHGPKPAHATAPAIRHRGTPIRYTITLEANHMHWLPALDLPVSAPANSRLLAGGSLYAKDKVTHRKLYHVTSYTHYTLQQQPSAKALAHALRLPDNGNPRARKLARHWHDEGLPPAQTVQAALDMFRHKPFVYTLRPPVLPEHNSIDAFLFGTRRGFCEHYAGAFTFLMRAAGVPARVVVGYQGGEPGALDDYLIVRNANAHAWSEVWLKRKGWVRVDPTAAVAPQRVETGLYAALGSQAPVPFMVRPGHALLHRLALGWDWANATWNRWFLAYGPELQHNFWRHLGLPDMRAALLALTLTVTAFLGLLSLLFLRQSRGAQKPDPAHDAWRRFCGRLHKAGAPRQPHEGPQDFAERVIRAHPRWREPVNEITALYIRLRYAAAGDRDTLRHLQKAVRAFHPRRRIH